MMPHDATRVFAQAQNWPNGSREVARSPQTGRSSPARACACTWAGRGKRSESAHQCAKHPNTYVDPQSEASLAKVMRRPASVPARAPMISQTMILPTGIDIIQSSLLGAFPNAARRQLHRKRCYALLCLRLRTLFLQVVLGHFPGFVGIVAVHALEDLERVRPQIFLINDAAGTNDKGLHAGDAILRGRRSQSKSTDHGSLDYKVHLSQWRLGSLPFQNLEIVAMVRLRLTGIRITLLKSFGHSFPNWPLP